MVVTGIVAILTGSRAGWLAIAVTVGVDRDGLAAVARSSRTARRGAQRSANEDRHRRPSRSSPASASCSSSRASSCGRAARAMAGALAYFTTALRMFADHPLTGVGPGGWVAERIVYTRVGELDYTVPHAHDIYLQGLAEMGLLGVVAGLVVVGLPRLARDRRDQGRGRPDGVGGAGRRRPPRLLRGARHPRLLRQHAGRPPGARGADRLARCHRRVARCPSREPSPGAVDERAAVGAPALADRMRRRHRRAGSGRDDRSGRPAGGRPCRCRGVGCRPAAGPDAPQPTTRTSLRTGSPRDSSLGGDGRLGGRRGDPRRRRRPWTTSRRPGSPSRGRSSDKGDLRPRWPQALARATRTGVQQPAVAFAAGWLADRIGDTAAADAAFVAALDAIPSIAADPFWTTDPGVSTRAGRRSSTGRSPLSPTAAWELALMAGDAERARSLTATAADPRARRPGHRRMDRRRSGSRRRPGRRRGAAARSRSGRLGRPRQRPPGAADEAARFRAWADYIESSSFNGYEVRILSDATQQLA